jgi:Arc/MetJ-type ribon-helix-helix transcriptional regulator
MPATPASEELTITLPKDLADIVRGKVASGEYATALDFITAAMQEQSEPDDPALEQWLHNVGVARYDAYDANPKDVYTANDVREAVSERLHPVAKAG